jgi:predicted 2-oxoglutarate/Fe(II)-dependent dioxygenase YbiX
MTNQEIDQNSDNSHKWDYYVWTDVFTVQQIKEINEFIDKEYDGLQDKKYGTANQPDGTIVKNISTVKQISYGKIKHLISGFVNTAYCGANFDFGYITFGPYDNESLNFNIYSSDNKDYYGWHIDESRSAMTDIKLTLLINLSTEPYEGGEFQLRDEFTDYSVLSKPGNALMFKSPILHRVLPVTSGTRKTLTIFIYGPKFR